MIVFSSGDSKQTIVWFPALHRSDTYNKGCVLFIRLLLRKKKKIFGFTHFLEAKYVEHLLLRAPKKFDDPYQTMLYYQGLHIKYDRNRDGVGLKKASYYLQSERMKWGEGLKTIQKVRSYLMYGSQTIKLFLMAEYQTVASLL